MSNEQNTSELENTPATPERSELDLLKAQADRMGISYSANISVTTLKGKIQKQLAEADDEEVVKEATVTEAEAIQKAVNESMKLVRVIITPLDSVKAANMDTDVFTVSNGLVGTITRTIPFGREWHVEQILLNSLRERQFQQFTSKKNSKGILVTTSRLVPAYGIAELPPLTKEEIEGLAAMQARTGAIQDEG